MGAGLHTFRKHLNGIICTFHLSARILQRSSLGVDRRLGSGAQEGTDCQEVLSLSNKAAHRKLRDGKLICVRLLHCVCVYLLHAARFVLFVCVCGGGVWVGGYSC